LGQTYLKVLKEFSIDEVLDLEPRLDDSDSDYGEISDKGENYG
jgi:hypothetical protein